MAMCAEAADHMTGMRFVFVVLVAAVGLAGAVWCALRPLTPVRPPVFTLRTDAVATPQEEQPARIDATAFDIALWNPPADPEPEPAEERIVQSRQPPALEMDLVGIAYDRGTAHVILYDRYEDRLVVVADGGRLREKYTVRIVRADDVTTVELQESDYTHRLAMEGDA